MQRNRLGHHQFAIAVAAALLLWGSHSTSAAQWGGVDTNFNAQIAPAPYAYIQGLVARSNGGVAVGGQFNLVDGQRYHGLALLETNGTPASNFVSPLVLQSVVFSVASQSDGKLLISGRLYSSDAKPLPEMVRLLADGTIDSSFLSPFPPSQSPTGLIVRPDDQILAVLGNRVLRLGANGSLDETFQMPTNLFYEGYNAIPVASLPSGKTLISGSLSSNSYSDWNRRGVYRLLNDGSVDESFIATNYGPATALAVLGDGRIMVGSSSYSPTTNVFSNALTMLQSDGSVDPTFICPIGSNSHVRAIVPKSAQTLLVAGQLNSTSGMPLSPVVEVDFAGTIQSNYQADLGMFSFVGLVAVVPNGDHHVAGYTTNGAWGIKRLSADGSTDTNFSVAIESYAGVSTIRRTPDDRWIIQEQVGNPLRRVLPNGAPDPTFVMETNFSKALILSAIVQPDGKTVALGQFYTPSGIPSVVRFNTDGVMDTNFLDTPYAPFTTDGRGLANMIALSGNGEIVVSGGHFYVNWPAGGVADVPVLRLLSNGDVDPTFDPSQAFHVYSSSYAHLIQADGKILLEGYLLATNMAPMPALVRLLSSGALDTTFAYGPDPTLRRTLLALDQSGRVLLGEPISTNVAPPMVRQLPDGSADPSFKPALGTNTTVNSALVQSDGRILITGRLFTTNETYLSSVARLEPDGALDTTFFFESETNAYVLPLALTPEGNVMVGGLFGLAGGLQRMALVRLISAERPRLASVLSSNQPSLRLSGNVGRTYRIDHSADLTNWFTLTTELCTNGVITIHDPQAAANSNRFYRAELVPGK